MRLSLKKGVFSIVDRCFRVLCQSCFLLNLFTSIVFLKVKIVRKILAFKTRSDGVTFDLGFEQYHIKRYPLPGLLLFSSNLKLGNMFIKQEFLV